MTPDGQVVWRFLNPLRSARGKRSAIVRMVRYELARIEELLAKFGRHEAPPSP